MAYRLSTSYPFEALVRDLFEGNACETAAPAARASALRPPVDLIESDTAYLIRVELPGFDPATLDLAFKGHTLTLKGDKTLPDLDEGAKAHVSERRGGEFERSFRFPLSVDPEAIEARFEHGVLTVKVTKRPEVQPHKIAIEVAE
ncbi:MAG: Hsp20/alpha crystallin family protein [Planctomycetes bacterium]|nr:Hsp20/alpha crystallin family protein [Planctomycetota bacterium]